MTPMLLLLALAAPSHAAPKPSQVLATVNGTPIKGAQVAERLWKQFGDATLQELIDEALLKQAMAASKLAVDKSEVEARLNRIQSQVADEATFKQRLEATGTSLEQLRSQIEDQVVREQLTIRSKGLTVSDAEAKEFFEANKDRLGVPESVRLRHILAPTEKEAADFLVAVRAGADFAKLAGQLSIDRTTKDKGGDLGVTSRGMLVPDIEKVVFGLKAGEVSEPVRTPMGFHVFKVEEVVPAKPAVFQDIKADIARAMLADKIAKAWPEYLQELREKAKIERKSR
ncbi:MAG: peptidyl-prolyl cis-trans isomerase [Elusimicrobiota bacterium]